MHVHILGICGTFMGSLALLARDLGHKVTGSDTNIYPPMSTQLERAGIRIDEGYHASHLQPAPDMVIVGNAMSRGNEAVEYMLNQGLAYTSGPQFLSEHVLQQRHVLAVAGTHGKTTTTTMLAWVLQYCGIDTGFLIGGVPLVQSDDDRLNEVFAHSSYLGAHSRIKNNSSLKNTQSGLSTADTELSTIDTELSTDNPQQGYFVIEADEYDSAFFDKRSKFVHYRPRTAILNNLEFDHADIFKDLDAIQTQFHHMIRMIPSHGRIIMPANTPSLEDTIAKGSWSPIWRTQIGGFNGNDDLVTSSWKAELLSDDGSHFNVIYQPTQDSQASAESTESIVPSSALSGEVSWGMSGEHNVANALVAVAAAYDVGIGVKEACAALSTFAGIKRRMELIAELTIKPDVTLHVYDDFAHHPTAITTTLDGAKKKLKNSKIWAIIEPRSNTMKMGIHKDSLAASATLADEVIWYEPAGLEWGLTEVISDSESAASNYADNPAETAASSNRQYVMSDTQAVIDHLVEQVGQSGGDEAIIIMSNGGFEGIHTRLVDAFKAK